MTSLRYATGEEPRVGDRVRCDDAFCEPRDGVVRNMDSDGEAVYQDVQGHIRGWTTQSTSLLSRAEPPAPEAGDDNSGRGFIARSGEWCRWSAKKGQPRKAMCSDIEPAEFERLVDRLKYPSAATIPSGGKPCAACERLHAERTKTPETRRAHNWPETVGPGTPCFRCGVAFGASTGPYCEPKPINIKLDLGATDNATPVLQRVLAAFPLTPGDLLRHEQTGDERELASVDDDGRLRFVGMERVHAFRPDGWRKIGRAEKVAVVEVAKVERTPYAKEPMRYGALLDADERSLALRQHRGLACRDCGATLSRDERRYSRQRNDDGTVTVLGERCGCGPRRVSR